MPRYTARLLALIALALLLIAPAVSYAQTSANITGVIFLRGSEPLPSTAIVTIQLADVTTAGAPAVVVTERIFSTAGAQSPFSFTLPYNPAQINPARRYSIQGNVRVGAQTLYTTGVTYPVITGGAPTANLQITMQRTTTSGLPQSSGGGTPLLIAVALLIAGVAAMTIRRGLARA